MINNQVWLNYSDKKTQKNEKLLEESKTSGPSKSDVEERKARLLA